MIGLPARVGHDVRVRAFWRSAGAACCAVVLAGCSVFSGRSDGTHIGASHTPQASDSATAHGPGAKFTNAKLAAEVLQAARHDFETVFTYDYRDLSRYRTAGLGVTTGPFSKTVNNLLNGKSAQNLVAGQAVQVATSKLSALESLTKHGTSAAVLVHGALATTSARSPTGETQSVTIVLLLRLVHHTWRIASTQTSPGPGTIPANRVMRSAIDAAQVALKRIYGLRRASFRSDYAKAIALTTGTLQGTMTNQESSFRKTLVTGKYDLSAKIVGVAAMEPAVDVSLVVTLDEFRVGKRATKLGPYRHILLCDMTYANGKWLLASANPLT